jgi:hypothetical protein
MLLLALLALAGVFGRGPLAKGRAGGGGVPLRIEYDRLARHGAPGQLRFQVEPAAAPGGIVRLWLDRATVDGMEIRAIYPEPESTAASTERVEYTFRVSDAGRPGAITFLVEPDATWLRRIRAGLTGGPSVEFRQFVYP